MQEKIVPISPHLQDKRIAEATGPNGEITGRTSDLPPRDRFHAASRFLESEEAAHKTNVRIKACMEALGGDPNGLAKALEESGVLKFPLTDIFPVTAEGTLIYADQAELEHFLNGRSPKYMAKQRRAIFRALSVHRDWAVKIIDELTLIQQALVSGAKPGEILPPDSLRMSLVTELTGQGMIERIHQTRGEVQEVIRALMSQSEQGIEAKPLAQSMKQIGTLCRKMQHAMDELDVISAIATDDIKDGKQSQGHSGMMTVIERARGIFDPFIHGSHVITMQQLRELDKLLEDAGSYNANIGQILEDGIRAIDREKTAGHFDRVVQVEKELALSRQVPTFERVIRALDQTFEEGSVVTSYAVSNNRFILLHAPTDLIRQAEAESGIVEPGFTEQRLRTGGHSILPANNEGL